MIYADFEIICFLLPEAKSSKSVIQINSKNILFVVMAINQYVLKVSLVSSYGYKLVCVKGKFSQPFKTYLGKDALYNFINSKIAKSKYCSDVMKKHFNK